MRYSGWKVITEGLLGNTGWGRAWRDPAPKAEYDAIVIGGGGHGHNKVDERGEGAHDDDDTKLYASSIDSRQ